MIFIIMKHIFLNWKTNRFLLHFPKKSNQTIYYWSKNIDFLFHLSKNTQNKKHYIQNLKSRVKRNSRVTIYRRAFTKKKRLNNSRNKLQKRQSFVQSSLPLNSRNTNILLLFKLERDSTTIRIDDSRFALVDAWAFLFSLLA